MEERAATGVCECEKYIATEGKRTREINIHH